jgi:hypothetical protein
MISGEVHQGIPFTLSLGVPGLGSSTSIGAWPSPPYLFVPIEHSFKTAQAA